MSSQPVSGAAQLHLLFDQMADAVYLLDPDTSNIVWGNRKAWESLGLSAEEVLNHSVLSLQKDVHGMPQWSEIAAAIRATDCYRFNGRHRHNDGHEVVVEVNTTHFSMDGRPYFLSVARDITNRVEQERESQRVPDDTTAQALRSRAQDSRDVVHDRERRRQQPSSA